MQDQIRHYSYHIYLPCISIEIIGAAMSYANHEISEDRLGRKGLLVSAGLVRETKGNLTEDCICKREEHACKPDNRFICNHVQGSH